MVFHRLLSMAVISLGICVSIRVLTEPLSIGEAQIGVVCCVGLIGAATWLLKNG